MAKVECTGRAALEENFNGDLEAYAEDAARPKPPGVESDPHHPWHLRKRIAKLTVDLPDDCILPRHLDKLYTRQEVCDWFEVSDSGFSKWKVPPRGKSGKYTLYAMSDVFAYLGARASIEVHKKMRNGERPAENIHQIAARLTAENQNEDGPAKIWYPPDDPVVRQAGLFT